ncbi:hypothetical protein G7046_g2908 [Stylonectria norvegica]|nr:hypothetical protein G7046_g2908 [Stylonectria norvegica]
MQHIHRQKTRAKRSSDAIFPSTSTTISSSSPLDLDDQSALVQSGAALAATCLLRSYEILDEDVDPNRHLLGAYSLASLKRMSLGPTNQLLTSGFWNYLREDITFSLYETCPLKMSLEWVEPQSLQCGQSYLNSISLILGQIINSTFENAVSDRTWLTLLEKTSEWVRNIPSSLRPFSSDEDTLSQGQIPSVWFLRPFQASAIHYYLVSLCVLAALGPAERLQSLPRSNNALDSPEPSRAEILEEYALKICGIAFTTRITPVLVNAFGPISYCAKFIRSEAAQQEVIRNLTASKKAAGWPVERLIGSLQAAWAELVT